MFETFRVEDYPIFSVRCVEWRQKRRQPIRGRLYALIAWALSWQAEQIFSSEFQESWEVRSDEALASQVCVRHAAPFDGATMGWGMADFPRKVTIGEPTDG